MPRPVPQLLWLPVNDLPKALTPSPARRVPPLKLPQRLRQLLTRTEEWKDPAERERLALSVQGSPGMDVLAEALRIKSCSSLRKARPGPTAAERRFRCRMGRSGAWIGGGTAQHAPLRGA